MSARKAVRDVTHEEAPLGGSHPRGSNVKVLVKPVLAALVAMTFVVSGCAGTDVTSREPVDASYEGPLYVSRSAADHPAAGAAGDIVNCDRWGSGGFSDVDVYGDGATATSAEQALKVAAGEGGFGGAQTGLDVAKQEKDRVLYVLDVDGVAKQAVIVHDGPATKGAGGPGWYVESWAVCDYAELPGSFTDSLGLQVWTDATGAPAPTSDIESWVGPEHCNWQSMTFLDLDGAVYVRNPQPDLADYFAEPYEPHAQLPASAVDTGFRRGDEHLWLSADEQRAFVGTTSDVEVWPRSTDSLGCA